MPFTCPFIGGDGAQRPDQSANAALSVGGPPFQGGSRLREVHCGGARRLQLQGPLPRLDCHRGTQICMIALKHLL